jgi:hypothetical protein
MGSSVTYYIVDLGELKDWEQGPSCLYYIDDLNGEKCLPVFSTVKKAQKYIENDLGQPQAHLDMLENVGTDSLALAALTKGQFRPVRVDVDKLVDAAIAVDVDYLVRDPAPLRRLSASGRKRRGTRLH